MATLETTVKVDAAKIPEVATALQAASQVAGFFTVYGIEGVANDPTLREVGAGFVTELFEALNALSASA